MLINKIDKKHYKQLAIFLSKYFLPKKNIDYYEKKFLLIWDNNPSYNDKDTRGFIIEDNNEIKGSILNVQIDYVLNKRDVKVSCPSFWYVKKDYRSYSLYILLEFINSYKYIINSTANKLTVPIYKRLEFIDINENNQSYIKINSYKLIQLFLEKYIIKKNNKYLSKLLFFLYFMILKLFTKKIRDNNDFEEVVDSSLVEKYSKLLKITFKNINWFFKNKNKKFFVFYNKLNELKYIISSENYSTHSINFLEILDSNIDDMDVFNDFEDYYLKKYKRDKIFFDYIWIHKIKYKFLLRNNFINCSKFKKNVCLVNNTLRQSSNIEFSALLGEYGIINDS